MYYKLTNESHESSEIPDGISEQGKSHCFCNNQTSETVVFHPDDPTTDFLSAIYEGKGWEVITNPFLEQDEAAGLINTHDRIICLGHGSPQGLFGGWGFIVDASLAPLLKKKQLIAIWCHADQFIEQHGLKGFYSGMFISELLEAELCGIRNTDEPAIESSNDLFASTLGKFVDFGNILEHVKREYNIHGDPIVAFNRNKLYSNWNYAESKETY